MQFPKFTIRDMVASQYRLMKEKLGIDHVVAVVGPSMGGMQVLQWGVSHPDYMDALVAMVPLAKTPAVVDRGDGVLAQGDHAGSRPGRTAITTRRRRRASGFGATSSPSCRRARPTCMRRSSRTAWTSCPGSSSRRRRSESVRRQ
jgi:pimeloyl-ACP methyl ester carboxylesterase